MNTADVGRSRNTGVTVPQRAPKLLVSVRNTQEAEAAILGGADWIDLKEPKHGPLAAVDAQSANQVAELLAGRVQVSAALGELVEWRDSPAHELLRIAEIGVVKLGLSNCNRRARWREEWRSLHDRFSQHGKNLAAVAYADHIAARAPEPAEILKVAQQSRAAYLLVDTYDKRSGSILEWMPERQLQALLTAAKTHGMQIVLAGSINQDCLERLPSVDVDMVAVRGAVCVGDRTGCVRAELVERFRHKLLNSCRWRDSCRG